MGMDKTKKCVTLTIVVIDVGLWDHDSIALVYRDYQEKKMAV